MFSKLSIYFLVILAPYGLNGTLTGQSYRETDQNAHKILEDWGKFYPIDMSDKDGDPAKTPALVEIIAGKFKIKASTGWKVSSYFHLQC